MNLELSKEVIERIIGELNKTVQEGIDKIKSDTNKTVQKEMRKLRRDSIARNFYSIPQAATKLNIDRHLFESELVDTGEIKLVIWRNNRYVPHQELADFEERKKHPADNKNKQRKTG